MSGTPVVVVVGSVNVDDVYQVDALPRPGETVVNARFQRFGGGKGANQAAAAASIECPVVLFAMVGHDADGDQALAELSELGVDVSHVGRAPSPTGRAAVVTTPDGDDGAENQIVVASGANAEFSVQDVGAMFHAATIPPGSVCLISAEVPDDVIAQAAVSARALGLQIVFNAAPARRLPPELLAAMPLLIVNVPEAQELTGSDSLDVAGPALVAETKSAVIVTRGAAGVLTFAPDSAGGPTHTEAKTVSDVVDTTGAGDAFCGVVAANLLREGDLGEAIAAGQLAGAAAVSALGARGWLV